MLKGVRESVYVGKWVSPCFCLCSWHGYEVKEVTSKEVNTDRLDVEKKDRLLRTFSKQQGCRGPVRKIVATY